MGRPPSSRSPAELPRSFRLLKSAVGLASIGATTYFAFTYSGPFRWLAELQLRLFGAYEERLTFFFTLLLLLVPMLKTLSRSQRSGWVPLPDRGEPRADDRATLGDAVRRLVRVQNWLMLAVLGGVLSFLALRDENEIQAGGELAFVSCADIEAERVPQSSWVEVEGKPLWDAMIEAEHNYGRFVYLPLVSANWSPKHRVGVVLRIDRSERRGLDGPTFRGTRIPDGMPGFVRNRYEDAGLDVGRALVVEVGRSPADKVTTARIFSIAGPLLLLVGLLGGALKWRRG